MAGIYVSYTLAIACTETLVQIPTSIWKSHMNANQVFFLTLVTPLASVDSPSGLTSVTAQCRLVFLTNLSRVLQPFL